MRVEKPEKPIPGPSNDIISSVCQTPYAKKKKGNLMNVSFKKKEGREERVFWF